MAAGRWWDEAKNLAALRAAAPEIAWPVEIAGPLAGPNGARVDAGPLRSLGTLGAQACTARMEKAALFVSPALYEPFGLSVLEAAGRGNALALADIPTFRELWDGAALFFPPRDRELLILRTGYLCRSDYEWAQHAALGLRIGLTNEELTRLTHGPDAAGWTPADATLLRAADELHRDQHISDATWARLRERFDDRQMMDIIFTVGQYTIVSMYLNSAGVQLEKGQTGIPR